MPLVVDVMVVGGKVMVVGGKIMVVAAVLVVVLSSNYKRYIHINRMLWRACWLRWWRYCKYSK